MSQEVGVVWRAHQPCWPVEETRDVHSLFPVVGHPHLGTPTVPTSHMSYEFVSHYRYR